VRANVEGERPELLSQLQAAFSQVNEGVANRTNGDFLVVNTGGKKYVCTLLMVPTT